MRQYVARLLAGERDAHVQLLERALEKLNAGKQSAAQAENGRATTVLATRAQAESAPDLTGLAAADQEKYQAIEVHRREQRVDQAYAIITDLADRYKDDLLVQSKACELGMAFRVEARFIMGYCARMSELSKGPKAK